MKRSKIMVIGGFLGAGKTTAMVELAGIMESKGMEVSLITNDQTGHLVDTKYVQTKDLAVSELAGSCFCCNFPGFKEKIESHLNNGKDFILAEPVGSCTDLVSTIMRPLKNKKSEDLDVLPLSVMAEPKRLIDYFNEDYTVFSKEVYYLFRKQLEEADFIVLNKTDSISSQEKNLLIERLIREYPKSKVIEVSALKGIGLVQWLSEILAADFEKSNSREIDIDYKTYAKAEAEMGWLNAQVVFHSEDFLNANELFFKLGETIKADISKNSGEIGHVKLFLESGNESSKLSCVGLRQSIDIIGQFKNAIKDGCLTINIRASVAPEILRESTLNILEDLKLNFGFAVDDLDLEAFRPGYPTPTYHM